MSSTSPLQVPKSPSTPPPESRNNGSPLSAGTASTSRGTPFSDSGFESISNSPTPKPRSLKKLQEVPGATDVNSPSLDESDTPSQPDPEAASVSKNPFDDERSRILLDAITELQSWGSHEYLDIPQLVIVGGQSTGKSSLLKTLTDIPFPIEDKTCTRFPTRIVSHRTQSGTPKSFKITIGPPEVNVRELAQVEVSGRVYKEGAILTHDEFTEAMQDVSRNHMGIRPGKGEGTRNFVSNVLRIELFGPDNYPFSILDLPGIFSSSSSVNSTETVGIEKMAVEYMKQPQNIIICVVASDYDLEHQLTFDLACEHVKQRERLVGVLTKCDRSNASKTVELANGEAITPGALVMPGNWFVVRNRIETDQASADASAAEKTLFDSYPWNRIPQDRRGSDSLRTKVANMLSDKIAEVFPVINSKITEQLDSRLQEQSNLGAPRTTLASKQAYVTKFVEKTAKRFEQALKQPGLARDNETKLRPIIRHLTDQFDESMRNFGHKWSFENDLFPQSNPVKSPAASSSRSKKSGFGTASRKDFPLPAQVQEAASLSTYHPIGSSAELYEVILDSFSTLQATQLPGVLNPDIYPIMYRKQTGKWHDMTKQHLYAIAFTVNIVIREILQNVCPPSGATKILHTELETMIIKMLDNAFFETVASVEEYCEEQQSADHMLQTSDPTFEPRVNECRRRRFAEATRKYKNFLAEDKDHDFDEWFQLMHPSVGTNIATDVHDVLMVYYGISLEYYIRHINKTIIEGFLYSNTGPLKRFNTEFVRNLSEEDIERLAREDDITARRREELVADIKKFKGAAEIVEKALKRTRSIL